MKRYIIILLASFLFSFVLGNIFIPFLKKRKIYQSISLFVNHNNKKNTPTFGGIIFIVPVLVIFIFLIILKKINLSYNLVIIILTFLLYGILGFLDDFKKVKGKNNKGISIFIKLLFQEIIAIIFFTLFILSKNSLEINIFSLVIDLKYLYGIFILFMLIAITNASNITDGLDGLCAGVSIFSFLAFGIIALYRGFIIGNIEISLFCFSMAGSLLAFLFFNFYPAKIFMGDLGSLAIGGALASISIVLKCEMVFLIIGIVYVIEVLSSLLQLISILIFKKKIFIKAPLHHHFEELGIKEINIIKIFYLISFIFSIIGILIYLFNII